MLDGLNVIHAGTQRYQLAEGIHALPATELNIAFRPLAK